MKYNEVMNNPAYMKYLRAINVVSYSLVLEFEDDGPICVKNRFGYNKIPLINLENGKEIVKAKRYLPILYAGTDSGRIDWDNKVEFEKIPQSVIEKIENGKARINLVAAYLEYGEYSEADDTGSDASDSNQNRAFIKNFPEIQLSLEKLDYEILDAPIQTDKED